MFKLLIFSFIVFTCVFEKSNGINSFPLMEILLGGGGGYLGGSGESSQVQYEPDNKQQTTKDCECVSYELCKKHRFIKDGIIAISIGEEEKECPNVLELCCKKEFIIPESEEQKDDDDNSGEKYTTLTPL